MHTSAIFSVVHTCTALHRHPVTISTGQNMPNKKGIAVASYRHDHDFSFLRYAINRELLDFYLISKHNG